MHRDIKPANLMAAYRGGLHDVAKLLDFGLVKTLSEDETAPHLSREGTVAGSPLYMAPEQIMHSHEPDRRTDIYALGAVAYFMLTGKPPFTGDKPDGGHDRARPRRRHSAVAAPDARFPPTSNASFSAALPRIRTIAIRIHRASPMTWTAAPTRPTGRRDTPPFGGKPTKMRLARTIEPDQ